jgi:hypothetical protein
MGQRSPLRKVRKRLGKIIEAAEAQGWTLEMSGNDHPRLRPPAGRKTPTGELAHPVQFPLTPSDHRSDKNSLAMLRRQGVKGV